MEGIVSKEVLIIQAECMELGGCTLSLDDWTKGLTVKLLEVTHGQWSYRNMQVHNVVGGIKAAQKKEELQKLIEDQIELGGKGLDKQDRYLLDINLEDVETSSGEDQYYWLVEIQAAREDRVLRRQQQNSAAGG